MVGPIWHDRVVGVDLARCRRRLTIATAVPGLARIRRGSATRDAVDCMRLTIRIRTGGPDRPTIPSR